MKKYLFSLLVITTSIHTMEEPPSSPIEFGALSLTEDQLYGNEYQKFFTTYDPLGPSKKLRPSQKQRKLSSEETIVPTNLQRLHPQVKHASSTQLSTTIESHTEVDEFKKIKAEEEIELKLKKDIFFILSKNLSKN